MAKRRKHQRQSAPTVALRAPNARTVSELLHAMRPGVIPATAFSWDLPAIMSARDSQINGRFSEPAKLAISMRTDPGLFVAYKYRLAPLRCLAVKLVAARGAARVAREAAPLFGPTGTAVTADVVADINGCVANHGFAIGCNAWMPRDDGSRVDVVHSCWPLDGVWWDELEQTLRTYVAVDSERYGMRVENITHGDGRWTVYAPHATRPWTQDAAVLPGGMVWARRAFGERDWCMGSASHGNAKVVGELPEGQDLQVTDAAGNQTTSPYALALLALVEAIANLDNPAGIVPAGAKVQYLTNSSRAWEVWERLVLTADKEAARVYLGTDGILGSQGGAPGVDISQLFGVATTIIQGDKAVIERGIREGVMAPWAEINYGDPDVAPERLYQLPDADEQRVRVDSATNEAAFVAAIAARRAAGLVVTQDWVDALAEQMGVDTAELAATQATGFQPAPTDVAKVITANEMRGAVGFPARDDGDVPAAVFGQPTSALPGQEQGTPQEQLSRGSPLIELSVPQRFRLAVEGDLAQEPDTLEALRGVPGVLLVSPDGEPGEEL